MNLRTLLREAVTAARTSPVPSALVLLVVAAMCFAAVATVGRQAATEAAVAAGRSAPASYAPAPLGQSFRRRTRGRVSASAGRRDHRS